MEGYLGEVDVDLADTPFNGYTASDWALYFISVYGGFDGAHHKDWVLDQAARALKGGTVTVTQAAWSNGHTEWRVSDVSATPEYDAWVADLKAGEDGPDTYSYSTGIAP